jgi:hypothetical protein
MEDDVQKEDHGNRNETLYTIILGLLMKRRSEMDTLLILKNQLAMMLALSTIHNSTELADQVTETSARVAELTEEGEEEPTEE